MLVAVINKYVLQKKTMKNKYIYTKFLYNFFSFNYRITIYDYIIFVTQNIKKNIYIYKYI